MKFLGGIWKRKVNGETLDYYPCPFMVGDIFVTTNTIKPEVRYPGTEWEELPEETFLMIASSKYTVKSSGGENEVTLTVEQIPAHTHPIKDKVYDVEFGRNDGGGGNRSPIGGTGKSHGIVEASSVGGGQPHNNMPKFYAIYGYRRIA